MGNRESESAPKSVDAASPAQKPHNRDSTDGIAEVSEKLHSVLDLAKDDGEDIPRGASSREDASKESKGIYKFDYVLVDKDEALKDCLENIKNEPVLALDCEGDTLSRHGKLQLLSVATRTKAYLVDVSALKSAPFEAGFRAILEDKNTKKLVFDCREDADALFHQFHVKLDGVLDIQLLEVIKRIPVEPVRKAQRRSDRLHEVVRLRGLLDCITLHDDNKAVHEIKKRGAELQEKWGERPLSTQALEYAATDVLASFHLFEKLQPNEEELNRLEIASGIYVDLKRSKAIRTNDKFEHNCYLPIDVVPEKGQTGFERGYTTCTKCYRSFPGDEFSKNQLNKGVPKCRTCKRVKEDIDTHENRMRNIERDEEERDRYEDMYDEYEEYNPWDNNDDW